MSNQRLPDSGSSHNLESRTDELRKDAQEAIGESSSWKMVPDIVRHVPAGDRAIVAIAAFAFIAIVAVDQNNPQPAIPTLVAMIALSAFAAVKFVGKK